MASAALGAAGLCDAGIVVDDGAGSPLDFPYTVEQVGGKWRVTFLPVEDTKPYDGIPTSVEIKGTGSGPNIIESVTHAGNIWLVLYIQSGIDTVEKIEPTGNGFLSIDVLRLTGSIGPAAPASITTEC